MPPPGDVLSGMEFVEAEGWEILPPESRSCCGASSAAGGKTLEVTPPPKISFFIQSLPSRRARFSVDCERGVTARWPPPFFRASPRPSREPGPAGVNARFNRSPLRSFPSHSVFFYRTSRGPVDGAVRDMPAKRLHSHRLDAVPWPHSCPRGLALCASSTSSPPMR
jgi:hypothetical protein